MELLTIFALSNAPWWILAMMLLYFLMPRLMVTKEFYVRRTTDLIKRRGIFSFSTEASAFEAAGGWISSGKAGKYHLLSP
jgi:hypothetical protein